MDFTKDNFFIPDAGVLKADDFSIGYALMNEWMDSNLEWQNSRAGEVKEILNFKTILTNPYRRCVGADKRNVNVFFLLAEAMWIFAGKADTEFLTIFNSNMSQFSDDGKVFHAPYGFRLRHWGIRAEDKYSFENLHAAQGFDQISDIIKLFSADHDSRQAVAQIWNPDFDLGVKSKDIPCNDTLMFKIRNGKLHTTIQNRSNDLHWGLPTNIFQFSFLSEMMANCLGIELGTQVHNSQSLHVYKWNETTQIMIANKNTANLYSVANEMKMDFNFSHEVPNNRLRELDYFLNNIINNLTLYYKDGVKNNEFENELNQFSMYLGEVYILLKLYIDYKKKNIDKHTAFKSISFANLDILVLAKNFFASRIDGFEHEYYGKL